MLIPRPEALDWLCLHVPEGDLPEKYRPNHPEVAMASQTPVRLSIFYTLKNFITQIGLAQKTPKSQISLNRLAQETLARLYKARRLAVFGFSEIEALRLLHSVNDDEYIALDALITELLPDDCPEKPEYVASEGQRATARRGVL
jgi:hypothetical protein